MGVEQLEVKQLQSFVAIVDHGSLAKASARLHVSAATISTYVSQLEAEFGTDLLVRLPRGVAPTDAGKALYRGARGVLQAVEQARHGVAAAKVEVAGPVRVCLPTSPATILSLPLLGRLRERHPGIRLELFEGFSGDLEEMMNQNRYDLGLLYRAAPIKGLIVEPLVEEDLMLVGGFAPDDHRDIRLADAAHLRFVLPSRRHDLRRLIDRAFAAQGLRPEVVADLDTLQALREAALSGQAATILSVSGTAFRADRPYGASLRRVVEPAIKRTVALCRPEDAPMAPVVEVTAGLLTELVRQSVQDGSWTGARLLG